MESSLRPHNISFVVPLNIRKDIVGWLNGIKDNFCSLLARANKGGTKASNASSRTISTNYDKVGLHMEDVLEGATVQHAVLLTSNLGHFDVAVRLKAAQDLYRLACILDTKVTGNTSKFAKVLLSLQLDDGGMHAKIVRARIGIWTNQLRSKEMNLAIHDLFQIIAPSFNVMIVALVASLECVYTFSESGTKAASISALARSIFENEKVFIEDDQHILFSQCTLPHIYTFNHFVNPFVFFALAAVWNLYFCLNAYKADLSFSSDRLVVIKVCRDPISPIDQNTLFAQMATYF
jgi:hypothetical protein